MMATMFLFDNQHFKPLGRRSLKITHPFLVTFLPYRGNQYQSLILEFGG
jgi:hypothetical protein